MLALRLARIEDCPLLVRLFDMSNGGLTQRGFAADALPGEDWIAAGARLMARTDVEYSYANTIVAEWDGALAGMIIFAVQPAALAPLDPARLPPSDRPFAVLKQHTAGTLYLRNMAVFEAFRGRRIAEKLLDAVIEAGLRIGISEITAIVHDGNHLLLAHYAKRGLQVIDRHPVLEHPVFPAESTWLLLRGKAKTAFLPGSGKGILAESQPAGGG